MSRGKQYQVGDHHFPTQASLEAEIRERLDMQPLNVHFYDGLIAEVINHYHAGVQASGQFATGWFLRLDYAEQLARGIASPVRGETPVLVAQFFPSGHYCELTAFPWRRNSHRYPDIAAVLTGKAPPPMAEGRDWEAEVIG